jgi:prepilin-type N-terminal cleavage/methylation domain-containing protein
MSLPLRTRFPRPSNRSGFTLVEILVVIAIIALLAGVALPAVTGALKKAKENVALQEAHGLSLALFQYANDNDGTYPGTDASKNQTVASSTDAFKLMVPTYISNTDSLFIAGPAGKSKYAGSQQTGFTSQNVCWDLTCQTGDIGLGGNDPDQLPVIISTGSTITYPSGSGTTAGTAVTATIAAPGTACFGTDGVAVGYKDMSSAFKTTTATTVTSGFPISSASIVPAATYVQLQP